MPPTERGPGRGKSRKRKSPSIRDAAASAAGSASVVPAPGAARRARTRRAAPGPSAERPQRGPAEPEVAAAPTESRPPFPDFDSPSGGWDPWGGNTDTEANGGRPGPDRQRTLGDWFEAVIPPEAQVHFIRAGQEFAAGVQTTVDHHLGRGSGAVGARPGPSRIEIE